MEKKVRLEEILDKAQGLYQLANCLNWDYLVEHFGEHYVENKGRLPIPIRVVVGLHYLKYLENESDETVVEKFCQNPYWQYFCGFKTFQHRLPCHPTTLVKWRKKAGEKGIEKLLVETIHTAKREALLPEKLLRSVNVDTTVQEKAITYPTDAKLCYQVCQLLQDAAHQRKIKLRQSYTRVSKKSLVRQARYRHANQHKRARKELKKLRVYAGRLIRDIERKHPEADLNLREKLQLSQRIINQRQKDKNKIYSLHAPEVECIGKGKAHKKYEFGCKVSLVTTCKEPWVLSINAMHGNPYDGHTLDTAINEAASNSGVRPEFACVDQGYRGKKHHPNNVEVIVSGKGKLSPKLKKLSKGRQAIEPIIGHLKTEHRLGRNFLKGKLGDKINAILAGCAFNLKKIIRNFQEKSDELKLSYLCSR